MTRQLLFLLGGGDVEMAAEEFAAAAGGRDARIALLMQGDDHWGQYVGRYVEPWRRRGACRVALIVPGADGALDLATVETCLREATGIFIGGGDTSIYHHLYATEPIRSIIRERYRAGTPVGGISAGALIAPEICGLPAGESYDGSLQVVTGLGLVSGCVVGVHFSEQNALPDCSK